ncbi:testis-expressed protein 264-like, partial [Huso huso]
IMSEFILLALISFLFLFLLLTVLGVVLYSGLFTEVIIRTGSSPIKNITIAYKFKQGSYKDSGAVFTESCSIGPKLSSIGVYYDDPKQTEGFFKRSVSVLYRRSMSLSVSPVSLKYECTSFTLLNVFSLMNISHILLLPLFGVFKRAISYKILLFFPSSLKERKLCAHPFLELYRGDLIYYICPLARQGDFYVPEMRETERRQKEKEEDSEDRQTDITGKAFIFTWNTGISHFISNPVHGRQYQIVFIQHVIATLCKNRLVIKDSGLSEYSVFTCSVWISLSDY